MKKFKIACIQMASVCGEVEENLNAAARLIAKATIGGAKIVCLPELFDSGYDLKWLKRTKAKHAAGTLMRFGELAKRHQIYIVGGIARVSGRKMFNSMYLFSPEGKVVGFYDKNFLFRGKPQEEHKYFEQSDDIKVFDTKYGRIGLAICNDVRYSEIFSREARLGAKIIFVCSAFGMKRLDHWLTLPRARAFENQVYVATANMTGKCAVEFAGHSHIIDFDGNFLSMKKSGEGVIFAEIDYKALEQKRRELPTFASRKGSR